MWSLRQQGSSAEGHFNYKKSHGAENRGHWPQHYDELEHNEVLQAKGISADEVRFGGGKLTA